MCSNLFYCLVKYTLANIRDILGVVNDSKSVVLNRVSEGLFSDIKQKGTHGRDFERWTCPDQAESDSGSKTASEWSQGRSRGVIEIGTQLQFFERNEDSVRERVKVFERNGNREVFERNEASV